MHTVPDHISRREALAASAAMMTLALMRESRASSVDGHGISNADVLAGFSALQTSRFLFQSGEPFVPKRFAGRALLVNFWANWCINCLAEFDSMKQLQIAAGGSDQLAIVLVSQPQDWERDQQLARQRGVEFPLARYVPPPNGSNAELAALLFGSQVGNVARYALPVCYMVSRSGEIVLGGAGAMQWTGKLALSKAALALHS